MEQDSIDKFEGELLQIAKSIKSPIVELDVGEISGVLNNFRWAIHNLIKNSSSRGDTQAQFSDEDILIIDCFFSELADNFFPMAHTDKPLKDLKISENEQYRLLHHRLEREIDSVELMKFRLEKLAYDLNSQNSK